MPDKEKDERLASFILDLHHQEKITPEIEAKFIRKYIAYAKQNIFSVLTEGAIEEIKKYYSVSRFRAYKEGKDKYLNLIKNLCKYCIKCFVRPRPTN